MKRTILTAALAVMTLSATAEAHIDWLDVVHDFGAFKEEVGSVTCEFKFVNVGDEDLVITGARASCGCTKPRYPLDAIAPGDTAAITVTYNAEGRPGHFKKSVHIESNDIQGRSTLTITGTVIGEESTVQVRYPIEVGDLRLRQPSIQIGDLTEHHIKSVFVDGYNMSTDTIRPAVVNLPRWAEVTIAPAAVAPGEQMSFNFFITADRAKSYGPQSETVTFVMGDARRDMKIEMDVHQDLGEATDNAIAKSPRINLSTQHIAIEDTGDSATIERTVTVKNTGRSALTIHRVYAESDAVSAKVKKTKLKPGASTPLTVTIDRSRLSDTLLDTILTIISDDITEPETSLRLTVLTR